MRPEKIQKIIGQRLAQERAALDYTQAQFAKLIGCSQPQYSRYEDGSRAISSTDLQVLAAQLQLPVESFYPATERAGIDDSEVELLTAWRSRDIRKLLALVSERLG